MEIRSIEAVCKALNQAGVRYLVVGGIAVNAHGYARMTKDLDLVIGLNPENIETGITVLLGVGYNPAIPVTAKEFANPSQREYWRKHKEMLVLKMWSDEHRRTPLDIFVYEPFPFADVYSEAKVEVLSGGIKMPVVPYQTLLAMKEAAGRPQDIADIAQLRKLDSFR